MTRGTTRQILADLEHHRTHPSPIHITRSDETGLVQVTVSQPPEARTAAMKLLLILLAVFGLLALSFAALELVAPLILFGWLLVCTSIVSIASYDRAARAYVFRAGLDRIVVASSGPLGPRYWDCTREHLRDVRLLNGRMQQIVFDLARGRCCMRAFPLDLQRERLIELVDAVREGLGMAKMEWK